MPRTDAVAAGVRTWYLESPIRSLVTTCQVRPRFCVISMIVAPPASTEVVSTVRELLGSISTVDPSKYVRTARPSSPVSIVSPGPMTSPSAAAATVAPAWRTLTEPPITVTVVDAPTAWPRLGASTPLTPSAIASTKASVSPPTAMRRRDELRTSLPVPTQTSPTLNVSACCVVEVRLNGRASVSKKCVASCQRGRRRPNVRKSAAGRSRS